MLPGTDEFQNHILVEQMVPNFLKTHVLTSDGYLYWTILPLLITSLFSCSLKNFLPIERLNSLMDQSLFRAACFCSNLEESWLLWLRTAEELNCNCSSFSGIQQYLVLASFHLQAPVTKFAETLISDTLIAFWNCSRASKFVLIKPDGQHLCIIKTQANILLVLVIRKKKSLCITYNYCPHCIAIWILVITYTQIFSESINFHYWLCLMLFKPLSRKFSIKEKAIAYYLSNQFHTVK